MNYQTINIGDKKLFLDIDKKRTACRDCEKMIRFAQDEKSNWYVVEMISDEWVLHYKHCNSRIPSRLEENIKGEELNQEFLNGL